MPGGGWEVSYLLLPPKPDKTNPNAARAVALDLACERSCALALSAARAAARALALACAASRALAQQQLWLGSSSKVAVSGVQGRDEKKIVCAGEGTRMRDRQQNN
jgi:hypothetical protein